MAAAPSRKAAKPSDQQLRVSVDLLQFDEDNPRFADADNLPAFDDLSIIKYYSTEVDLAELLDSISTSGYIDFDPMLVMRKGAHYIVLEGNRRLAALRILRDRNLASRLHLNFTLSPAARKSLDHITVRVMKNRAEARAYIGFKHINGPHKWDSMAKAQYATEWLRDGGSMEKIARTLGDRNNLVKRLVFGYVVLEQAEANGFERADIYPNHFHFSHLYTALTRPGYRSYLGLDPNDLSFDPRKNPISRTKISNLLEMMTWLFGSRDRDRIPAVRSQNPDLNRLNEVLQRKDACRAFLAGQSLDQAFEYIEPKSNRFSEPLFAALGNVQRAIGLAIYYEGQRSLLVTASDLVKGSQQLLATMEAQTQTSKKKKKK